MKCKIFERSFAGNLEANVNAWLASDEKIEIKYILQSESMTAFEDELSIEKTTTITIFYEEM